MSDYTDIIGREDIHDYDAILAVTNTDVAEVRHAVHADADAIFTWNYERSRPALVKLYEKAKTSQWNANDLPWDIDVDQEKVAARQPEPERHRPSDGSHGHAVREVGRQGVDASRSSSRTGCWSQFLHGEQGALVVRLADRRDRCWIDVKLVRLDAGDGRGAPRRGLRRYLETKVWASLPGELDNLFAMHRRRPGDAALGHEIPRHADHGEGLPRPRSAS